MIGKAIVCAGVEEKIAPGIYIQGISGKLYTEDEWSNQETANGVAVVTENCEFVMALEDAYSSSCKWGSYGTTVDGITTTTSSSEAAKDYDGEAQTTTILNQLGASGAPAANYCRAYTFPDGKVGYMGAAGEWQAALDNKAAIESALSKCGGSSMGDWYWTSTQHSSNKSCSMSWSDEYLRNHDKRATDYIRAFCSL